MCSYQTVRPTHPRHVTPAYPFTVVWSGNAAPLIISPEADQKWSEISPLAASETLTQRRMHRIGTGSPQSKSHEDGDTHN